MIRNKSLNWKKYYWRIFLRICTGNVVINVIDKYLKATLVGVSGRKAIQPRDIFYREKGPEEMVLLIILMELYNANISYKFLMR